MKIILFNWNNILTDVENELLRRGHDLLPMDGKEKTWKSADVMVVWNETNLGGWRDWIKEAQALGIRVVLVQHGRKGTSRIYPPFNEQLVSDVACVWGEGDRKRLMSVGVPSEKIVVTGTPIFRHLKPRVPHKGINVVFSPEHWDVDVSENLIVADQLRKVKGVKIITKTLQGEQMEELYDNVVSSNRSSPDHLDIVADVLSTADVVVGISESTFELCAQILDIPVVIADIWIPKACDGDDRYKDYHREYSDACLREKDVNKLKEAVYFAIENPDELSEERKKVAISDGGINLEDPLSNIINVIENGTNN